MPAETRQAGDIRASATRNGVHSQSPNSLRGQWLACGLRLPIDASVDTWRDLSYMVSKSEYRTVGDSTELLRAANAGDRGATARLFSVMYEELRGLARRSLRSTGRPWELNTTMLVHESFLKLTQGARCASAERLAFYSYMAKVMRSVALDAVRESRARKRGGDQVFVELTTGVAEQSLDDARLLGLDDALNALAHLAPDLKELVELRCFAGLTVAEVSELTGKSARSVDRNWQKAGLLLRQLMAEG